MRPGHSDARAIEGNSRPLKGHRAYDVDWLRRCIEAADAGSDTPSKVNRRWRACFGGAPYRWRDDAERFFCKIKHYSRIVTRYG